MLYESEYYGVQSLPFESYLEHHGIKGQKWGVRRFQYGDGRLTPAGRERYGVGESQRADKNTIGVRIETIDKETGLKLKTKQCTPEEDMKVINPGFRTFEKKYQHNCSMCTAAYEMRRRGYDVIANTNENGASTSEIMKWFPGCRLGSFSKANTQFIDMSFNYYSNSIMSKLKYKQKDISSYENVLKLADAGKNKPLSDTISKGLISQGDGTRGCLLLAWGRGAGHAVTYEVNKGKLTIRDAQSNKTFSNPEEILSYAVGAFFIRLDNVKFDKDKIKEAVR